MSVILNTLGPEGRAAIAEIFNNFEHKGTPRPVDDWLTVLIAWLVDSNQHLTDERFASALQLTWMVGTRLEAELCGRFKVIIPVESPVFPFTDPAGELQGGVIDTVKFAPMSADLREITCALAAEMTRCDADHDTLYILSLVRKDWSGGYSSRFATAKTA